MDWKFLFFSTEGRIGRKDFWIGALILIGAQIVAGLAPLVGWVGWLVIFWCALALGAKRLHDFGKSGWLQVVPMAACMVIGAIGVMLTGMGLAITSLAGGDPLMAIAAFTGFFGVSVVMSLIYLGFILWVGLSKGEPGSNQYGPAPRHSQFDGAKPPADSPPPPAA